MAHSTDPAKGWGGNTVRVRGRRLQRLRQQLFSTQPLCAQCMKDDRVTMATIRDHIIPMAEGGTEDPSNIQGLCQPCSDAKTQEESRRGVRRNH